MKMKGLSAIPKIVLGTNLGFSALVALTSGLFACWIGGFALLGTREVMDDLFSEFPLREDANPKLHQRSRWDERAGGVGAARTVRKPALGSGRLGVSLVGGADAR